MTNQYWWDVEKSTFNKYVLKLNYVSATNLCALLVLTHLTYNLCYNFIKQVLFFH